MDIPARLDYDFHELEKRWRTRWLEEKTFQTPSESNLPKCYVLDMFPYPSGSGLHIGHPKGYIATDIYSRFKRMQGFNVLHPIGFDSFGLPAEQYAIEHNIHPAIITEQNIDTIRAQLKFLGLSYDWDREIATSREDYYRWTQWMFRKFFESWFDQELQKARPISELIGQFESGSRKLEGDKSWKNLSVSARSEILNNYRIAYFREVTVNWCPRLGTVLANEEVTNDGKSERGNFPVYKRPLKQAILRITAYADRLLSELDSPEIPDGKGGTFSLDWPEPIKIMQRNWIGRSEGADVIFEIFHPETGEIATNLTVYTTRPDTLFGATFMVVAPEHPMVTRGNRDYLVPDRNAETVEKYIRDAIDRRALLGEQEEKEKTGVNSGIVARNPVNGEQLPIFVADYVSIDYGSGAIMAVPAHDDRDFEFAKKYNLPIIEVVQPPENSDEHCYTGDGISINSGEIDENPFAITGLPTEVAKSKITEALEAQNCGSRSTNYKLRDWIFSRQRYWGEPFPIAVSNDGEVISVDGPVPLPEMENFKPEISENPDETVKPPLSRADRTWQKVIIDGVEYQRELNVMPQWAGSCWYFLRFIDPKNIKTFCDETLEQNFMPIDLYVGGAEHAVLHLLYARFWHKVLYDLGFVSTPEPFKKLFNQGMITADAFTDDRGIYIDIREVEFRNGEPYHSKTDRALKRQSGKMGKRFKNGLPPEEIGEEYGVDTLRLYEMYMGPLEASTPWNMEGIRGMQRFLQRVWRNFVSIDGTPLIGGKISSSIEKLLHKTIIKVGDDIEHLRFNTAIAALIALNNELVKLPEIPKAIARDFILMLSPFAPHISEELWSICNFGNETIAYEKFPIGDLSKARDEEVTMAVQIGGKMRQTIKVSVDATDEEVTEIAKSDPRIARRLEGCEIRRVIVVPKRVINFIIAR